MHTMGIIRKMTIEEFKARLTYVTTANISSYKLDMDKLLSKYKKESYTACDSLGRFMSVNNFVKKELNII